MLPFMSEAGDPALIGRRIAGKFVVEKHLGGGSMGAVYRARDDTLERRVALKVMHPSVAVDPTFVTRFHREARAASRLDHPSSVRVIEFGEEPDGLLYMAMEYLEGRDLYKVIHEDWPLSEERIADIMMKALAAIAVAHEMGVIHRDLKPENIMILDRKDDDGRDLVKVCDFGIAKITERDESSPNAPPKTAGTKLTTAGLVVGTPEYMSPEQARGEKLDPRSDLYSMGVILYQLLTGRVPFLGDSALATVLKHISDPPEPPRTIYPGVHRGLEAVCMRALEKEREARFQTAREMRAAIKAVMEGKPLPEVGASPPSKSGDPPASSDAPPAGGEPAALANPAAEAEAAKGTPPGTARGDRVEVSERARPRPPFVIAAALAFVIGAAVVGYVAYAQRLASTSPAPAPEGVPAGSSEAPTRSAARPPDRGAPPSASALEIDEPPASPPPASAAPSATAAVSASAAPSASTPRAPGPFKPAKCRAVVGTPKAAGGVNVKDLSTTRAEAAWTTCAKSSIKERPSAPIAAAVRLRFGSDRSFKGAICAECPAALAACVASSSRGLATVNVRSDAGVEPELEVPVTFTCE
jgi:serine/threonine-protein kinase